MQLAPLGAHTYTARWNANDVLARRQARAHKCGELFFAQGDIIFMIITGR
jgi:hypothetical protein